MKAKQSLPDGYREMFTVNLQKDRKLSLGINIAALIIAAVMAVPVAFVIPIGTLFDFSQGIGMYLLRFGALLIFLLGYIILHELVHGITMRIFGTKHVKFGFTGLYAFAGSTDYYTKGAYIIIALAPVVFWGIVLGILCFLVSPSWFWVVYFIQITNISGAVGDIYVTAKFCRFPSDILVQDAGVGMKVYSKQI